MPDKKQQSLIHFFREAAPYIHSHRGKTFVIALSSETLLQSNIGEQLSDIAILSTLGAKIILVHGARQQIETQLKTYKHKSTIKNDLRITDDKTLQLSKYAIGNIRLEIENLLNRAFNRPPIINNSIGIISGNFLTAKPVGVIDGIDYLHTGKVRKINTELIKQLLESGNIVLLPPLGYSPTGQAYNLLFEEVASYTASQLNADKLIFIHENSRLNLLPKQLNLQELDKTKVLGKTPLTEAVRSAIQNGVERVHLLETKKIGNLLLELYTRDGISTMIDNKHYDRPRKAKIDDIRGILELIRPLEATGVLKKRSRGELELEVGNFSVIERDGKIIGCAALNKLEDSNSAELSCLTIAKNYQKGDRGIALMHYIVKLAKQEGTSRVIVFTTQSLDWFKERGFEEIKISELPPKRLETYDYTRNSKILSLTIK